MYFGDRLDLDSAIFQALRDEIMVSINAALMLADKEGKEGEVSIKIKVSTVTERNFKDGAVCKEWTEPRFSWAVTRKVKENKIDHKGSSVAGWELRFDEDGRPCVVEANQQASLFDEQEPEGTTVIHYHFGEKKPEVSGNEEQSDDTGTSGDDTTLDDDGGGIEDGGECESGEDAGEPDILEEPDILDYEDAEERENTEETDSEE
jgi:hypothetical protein